MGFQCIEGTVYNRISLSDSILGLLVNSLKLWAFFLCCHCSSVSCSLTLVLAFDAVDEELNK